MILDEMLQHLTNVITIRRVVTFHEMKRWVCIYKQDNTTDYCRINILFVRGSIRQDKTLKKVLLIVKFD